MPVIVGVALGGALGASTRYALDRLIEQRSFSIFPWATFTTWLRIGMVVGVIGGYTTFSTYAQEALTLFEAHDAAVALAYAIGSVVIGIAAVYAGVALGRTL